MSTKTFPARDGQTYDICIDDAEEIEVYLNGVKQGSIKLQFVTFDNPRDDFYYILDLNLKKCSRQGIGRQCLKLHKDTFGVSIYAADPNGPQMEDSSHLIDDGIPFIEQMRKEGLVC
ncbi:hypothetical protein [Serratia fonticola]